MQFTRFWICLVGLGLLLGLSSPYIHAATAAEKPALHIGIVYRADDTGGRILSGIKQAIKKYEQEDGRFRVEKTEIGYFDENTGLDEIYSIFVSQDKKNIHLIIGPSDSGIFVDMAKRPDYKEKASVPVVSSLITSQEGNVEGDWRFRTNVDVEARSRAISDYLNHSGYQAVGVLYRDNAFGKRAAEEFKAQHHQAEEGYLVLPYEGELQLREQVRNIIQQRPGAVGVFGRRHDVKFVKREIEALGNGWFDYRPLIFTIYDIRTHNPAVLPDVHFVSLVGDNSSESSPKWDEVFGLAYDTTHLVLHTAEQVPEDPARGAWAESFRKRLFSYLQETPEGNEKFKTLMEFSGGRNLSPLMVLKGSSKSGVQLAVGGHRWWELGKLGDWIEIRQRRFGNAIWFNLGMVLVIAIWLTLADIHRRQTIRSRDIYLCRPVLALILFNVVCAIATLIVVAETDVIRWDNILAVVGVAVGYRALLTTTIFETAQGQALGFGRLYERTLASINNRIMLTLYEKQSAAINYVTHTNSLPNMRDLLLDIYGFAQGGAGAQAHIEELDAEIARAQGMLKQREVCARRLLQTMSWKQLQENRIIPHYIKQDELIDPITMLRDSVQFVMQHHQELPARVHTCIDQAMKQLLEDSQKTHDQAQAELKADLDNSQTERGRLYCRLRWLFTQWGFSLRRIKQAGLLPEAYGSGTQANLQSTERQQADTPVEPEKKAIVTTPFRR